MSARSRSPSRLPPVTRLVSRTSHRSQRNLSHVLYCPLCRYRLEPPGQTVDGWPIALPAAEAVRAVRVVVDDQRLTVDLANGATISVPTARSTRLSAATPEQRAAALISEDGESLHWAEIDEDIGVSHLLGIPEDLASAANGSTIYPPHPDAELAQHVAALLLALLRSEAGNLERIGVGASAVLISRGASSTVTLTFEADSGEAGRSLIVHLTSAGRDATVEIKIVDDEQNLIAAVGAATVDPVDLAQVALALARAGIARLAVAVQPETGPSIGDTARRE